MQAARAVSMLRRMRRYLALARVPAGGRLLSASALVAPGQAAIDLLILLALHRSAGSFAAGGLAVAAATIGFSVSMTVQGRLIDRLGIARVFVPLTAVFALALAALAAAVAIELGPVLLVALSALLGLTSPSTGPATRTAWSAALDDRDGRDLRATAFSYTTMTQDAGFIVGPALFGLLATATTPVVSLGCCGALMATGTLLLCSAATPARERAATPPRPTALLRSLGPLAGAMAAVGVSIGALDVSTPAFATAHGHPSLSGVLLAMFSVGSLAGSLVYGARPWSASIQARLLACTAAMGALFVLPALAPGPALAVPALLIAGAPLGATFTSAYLLADELVPAGQATAGFALLGLALNGGAAAGNALAGQLAGRGSPSGGYLLAAGAGLLAAAGATRLLATSRRGHRVVGDAPQGS